MKESFNLRLTDLCSVSQNSVDLMKETFGLRLTDLCDGFQNSAGSISTSAMSFAISSPM